MTPTEPRQRLAVLDVLRGIALLGVLLGNTFHLYSGTLINEWLGWFET